MVVFKRFTFDSAHTLTKVPIDHKCGRLHGHTFHLQVAVEGPVDSNEGWVLDFADIKSAVEPILADLDHRYLNEIEGLENPTSENLCVWIWSRLKPQLPQLSEVSIQETCTSGCVYRGE